MRYTTVQGITMSAFTLGTVQLGMDYGLGEDRAKPSEEKARGILDAAERLADFPESGKRVFLPGGLDSGYRFLVFESWVVVYRIWRQEVQVARVIPAALDYMRVLFPWLRKNPDSDEHD